MGRKTFPTSEFGNPDGEIVILVAGWPDDSLSAWSPEFLNIMKRKYYMISCCLPDYQYPRESKPWGYSFPELVDMLDVTIRQRLEQLDQRDASFYMVCHDWGSFVGTLYQNKYPQSIKKIALLDVGVGIGEGIKDILVILFYQWWFAFTYIVSQSISFHLGNAWYRLFFALPFQRWWMPVPHDVIHRPQHEVDVSLCYPYYQLWRAFFAGNMSKVVPRFPSCPVLYMYGELKNAQFHSQEFLRRLDSSAECKHVNLRAGHWLTHFEPDTTAKEICIFFA